MFKKKKGGSQQIGEKISRGVSVSYCVRIDQERGKGKRLIGHLFHINNVRQDNPSKSKEKLPGYLKRRIQKSRWAGRICITTTRKNK